MKTIIKSLSVIACIASLAIAPVSCASKDANGNPLPSSDVFGKIVNITQTVGLAAANAALANGTDKDVRLAALLAAVKALSPDQTVPPAITQTEAEKIVYEAGILPVVNAASTAASVSQNLGSSSSEVKKEAVKAATEAAPEPAATAPASPPTASYHFDYDFRHIVSRAADSFEADKRQSHSVASNGSHTQHRGHGFASGKTGALVVSQM